MLDDDGVWCNCVRENRPKKKKKETEQWNNKTRIFPLLPAHRLISKSPFLLFDSKLSQCNGHGDVFFTKVDIT